MTSRGSKNVEKSSRSSLIFKSKLKTDMMSLIISWFVILKWLKYFGIIHLKLCVCVYVCMYVIVPRLVPNGEVWLVPFKLVIFSSCPVGSFLHRTTSRFPIIYFTTITHWERFHGSSIWWMLAVWLRNRRLGSIGIFSSGFVLSCWRHIWGSSGRRSWRGWASFRRTAVNIATVVWFQKTV